MPIVVATITPKPGKHAEVEAAFTAYIPGVHDEPGCELYALNRTEDVFVMVERWATDDDLATHASSERYKDFGRTLRELVEGRAALLVCRAVPAGDPSKGSV